MNNEYPEKLELKESSVHGWGVFALQAFSQGDNIAFFHSVPTSKDGTHVLWVLNDDQRIEGWRGTGVLRYLNHSSEPNCEFQCRQLVALKSIEIGDELLFHYGEDWKEVP